MRSDSIESVRASAAAVWGLLAGGRLWQEPKLDEFFATALQDRHKTIEWAKVIELSVPRAGGVRSVPTGLRYWQDERPPRGRGSSLKIVRRRSAAKSGHFFEPYP
jgi:hypothetical protein